MWINEYSYGDGVEPGLSYLIFEEFITEEFPKIRIIDALCLLAKAYEVDKLELTTLVLYSLKQLCGRILSDDGDKLVLSVPHVNNPVDERAHPRFTISKDKDAFGFVYVWSAWNEPDRLIQMPD